MQASPELGIVDKAFHIHQNEAACLGAEVGLNRRHRFCGDVGILVLLVMAGPVAALEVNPPLATGRLVIGDRVTLTVELARTTREKVRGLSGRPGLKPGHGMLFLYDRPQPVSIWMKDMRFSLDILWIRDGRIVHIEKQAPPLSPVGPEQIYTALADMVLEVPAGFADRQKIRVGDPVRTAPP
jgi:uncharacterized membrane protein (UPF0127 family)